MQVSQTQLRVLQVVVLLGALAVASGIILFFLLSDTGERAADITRREAMQRVQDAATVHFNRTRSYTAVCDEVGVPDYARCHSTRDAYAMEVTLRGGQQYYCIDSSGIAGVHAESKGEAVHCPQ